MLPVDHPARSGCMQSSSSRSETDKDANIMDRKGRSCDAASVVFLRKVQVLCCQESNVNKGMYASVALFMMDG
jgi:hypothetical protein